MCEKIVYELARWELLINNFFFFVHFQAPEVAMETTNDTIYIRLIRK